MGLNNVHWIVFLVAVLCSRGTNSICLASNDKPVIAKKFTLICNTPNITVYWYRNNRYIGWSDNQYVDAKTDGCNLTDSARYTFKYCGVKHELTIKSLDWKDNASIWRCQRHNSSISSNNYTISISNLPDTADGPSMVVLPEPPIHGRQFTITCTTTGIDIKWFKNGRQLHLNDFSEENNYIIINEVTKYDHTCTSIYNLTIIHVDYYRDNGDTFGCQAGTMSVPYTLHVNVLPKLITTDVPIDGKSFDITCFSTYSLEWSRKGLSDNSYMYVASSSPANGSSMSLTDYFEIKSRDSVNQTLTIKSVDFDRDNGSIFNCSYRNNHDSYILRVRNNSLFIHQSGQQLICVYSGVPQNNTTFLPWKHTIDNRLVREIDGYYINTTVYSLNITNSQNDGGNYTCTANNGISLQKDVYSLIPQASPTLYGSTTTSRTETIGANVTFRVAYLEDRTLNVSWNHQNLVFIAARRVTIREEPIEISHPYNNSIKLSGIETILTITLINTTDEGNYTCLVCNQYGCSSSNFVLIVVENVTTVIEGDKSVSDDTVIIGVSVSAAVLVIVVVVVIIIVIIRRRNAGQLLNSSDKEMHTYDTDNPKPSNIENDVNSDTILSQKQEEMEIIENDVYVSLDTISRSQNEPEQGEIEIIENDLYVSSDHIFDRDIQYSSEPPIYTQVKKAPIYAQVKKAPIYAKVKKAPIYAQDKKLTTYSQDNMQQSQETDI